MGTTNLSGLRVAGVPTMGVGGSLPLGQNYLFVNSATGSNGNEGTSAEWPLATLDFAFSKCVADRGYVIVVMPNHSETITGAAGIAHDVAGVSVIGIEHAGRRPRFLMDGGTAVTYAITAADAYVSGLRFISGHSNVVACITTTAARTRIDNCRFSNNTTNEDFLTCIKATSTTDNASDGLEVTNCRWVTSDADDLEFIEINATLNEVVVMNNTMITAGTASPLVLVAAGKLLTNSEIGWNKVVNLMTANELFISNNGTTNTGIIHNNYVGHADVTGAHDPGWDGGGFRLFNNLSVSVDNLSGLVLPAADVNL